MPLTLEKRMLLIKFDNTGEQLKKYFGAYDFRPDSCYIFRPLNKNFNFIHSFVATLSLSTYMTILFSISYLSRGHIWNLWSKLTN